MKGRGVSVSYIIEFCVYLHLPHDLLQIVDELLLVLVDLASFLGDDAGVDIEGLLEGDLSLIHI